MQVEHGLYNVQKISVKCPKYFKLLKFEQSLIICQVQTTKECHAHKSQQTSRTTTLSSI